MGWKKDRLEQGWKQQLVWLRPETVSRLERLKKSSGKSYQDILNEIILHYDRPLEDEETRLERKVLEKLQAYMEARLGSKHSEPENQSSPENEREEDEEFRIDLPDDLQDSDKRHIMNTIRELHENEGRSLRSIVEYLRQQGINVAKKGAS